MAVTCEVEAPSAMAFWKRMAEQLPLGRLAGSGDDRNDAKLLPKLGDGAQNGGFGHFPTQRLRELGKGGVARLQQFVGLDGQLRNLARAGQLRAAAPVAVAAQGIDVGQNPASHHKVGLFARLTQQIQPHSHAVGLQAHQQLFGESNMLGVRSGIRACRLRPQQMTAQSEEENCRLGQEETQSGLLNPRPGVLQGECPMSVQAHPFGARCFQLLRCQRKTSLPGWRWRRAALSPKRRAATLHHSNAIRCDGRPAGSPSKNTAKLLDVHAGNWLGGSVFASSNNSHSIRTGSRGVLTLMAE